ncbi:uncharacterized protein C6orf136 homolog [Ascaphus truei]|uniref:uncharacterized protein C6orf136 homolog n=1 Tax=Ascaphus truei TaxID=8439 RepID=UPI003F59DE37
MALCVRRLRGAPGLGGGWRSGVRGAGGGGEAGRVREGTGLRDVCWHPELGLFPHLSTPLRRPLPRRPTTPPRARLCPPLTGRDGALRQLQECLAPQGPAPQLAPPPCASLEEGCPAGRESWHLSGAQLDCFRSLFEPGICRTPYQALALPAPGTQLGVLAFRLSQQAAASPVPGGNQPDVEEQLALMHAKLREELPNFFLKKPDYSIYRKDVEFVNSILHIHTRGLALYQLCLTLSRLLFLSYFSNVSVSVLKLTSHPETCSIQARWAVSGLPLHSLLSHIYRTEKTELYRTFDAHSTFFLGSDGLISLHKLERVMPSPPLTAPVKSLLAAALVAFGLEESRPALNLLSTPLPPKSPLKL